MSRFTFRLESLRALREQAEQEAREELARELTRHAAHEAALSDAEERLRSAQVEGQLEVGATVAAHQLVSLQAYVERRAVERQAAKDRVAEQAAEVGARRRQLELAARERAVLERLKERREFEHRRAAARIEEAVLAEIALTAHRRAHEEPAA
jgi:flagellar FliJ protein